MRERCLDDGDEPALECMVTAIRDARGPGMDARERDLYGLISLNYPVVFEP